MYLVCDVYDDIKYARILNYKELRNLLIEELTTDLKENTHEVEIVVSCADELNKLAKDELIETQYIIDSLEGYGWEVYNITNIINDIHLLKDFLKEKYDTSDFDKVISLINNGINEIKKGD